MGAPHTTGRLVSLRFGRNYKNELCLIPFTKEYFPDAECFAFQQLFDRRSRPDVAFHFHNPRADDIPNHLVKAETAEAMFEAMVSDAERCRKNNLPLPCVIANVKIKDEGQQHVFELDFPPQSKKYAEIFGYIALLLPTLESNPPIVGDFVVPHLFVYGKNMGEDLVARIALLALLFCSQETNLRTDLSVRVRFLPTYTSVLACFAMSFPMLLGTEGRNMSKSFRFDDSTYRIEVLVPQEIIQFMREQVRHILVLDCAQHAPWAPTEDDVPTEPLQLFNVYKFLQEAANEARAAPLNDPRWQLFYRSMCLYRLTDEQRKVLAGLLGAERQDSVPKAILVHRGGDATTNDAAILKKWHPDNEQLHERLAALPLKSNALGAAVEVLESQCQNEGTGPFLQVKAGDNAHIVLRRVATQTQGRANVLSAGQGCTLETYFWNFAEKEKS